MATLKSTSVFGDLSVSDETRSKNILADTIIKNGGTNSQILLANGDVKNITDFIEATTTTATVAGSSKTLKKVTSLTYFSGGVLIGGSANDGLLMAKGINGVGQPDTNGNCSEGPFYINYDGTNTYNINRQLILQADSAGTSYGNNVYQYAAVRGDALKNYTDAKFLPLAGGTMTGPLIFSTANFNNNHTDFLIATDDWAFTDWGDSSFGIRAKLNDTQQFMIGYGTQTSSAVKYRWTFPNKTGTIALTSDLTDNDTKNTAGATNNTSKLYLVGATEQTANPQTYTNSNIYMTGSLLYSNNSIVATQTWANDTFAKPADIPTFSLSGTTLTITLPDD